MTTGARRGELCAIRWCDLDLEHAVLVLRRALYLDNDGQLREKLTKTHQQRRIALADDLTHLERVEILNRYDAAG